MKLSTRYVFRKMRTHKGQLAGMSVLIFVASLFFTTILTFKNTFQYQVENYLENTAYATTTLTGQFTEADVTKLSALTKVTEVQGRTVHESKQKDQATRLISTTSRINQLQIKEGCLPKNKSECAVIAQYAQANHLKLGDILTINQAKLEITGIVYSSEYIYYVQNARTMFADTQKFAIAFVTPDYFSDYNQLLIKSSSTFSNKELAEYLTFEQAIHQKDQLNYQMYEGDLDQFEAFAYIFPVIFWLMSFSIIFILLRRTILKEHKQIGIMKALGHNHATIVKIYVWQFGFMGLSASLLGCICAIPVSQWLLSIIKVMIVVPDLYFEWYPAIWGLAIGISTVGCLISGILSMLDVIQDLPIASMKPRMPKNLRKSLLERIGFLWKHLSFNSRYALKSTIRNKGRFLIMIIGVAASTALLVFSLGFNDSINDVTGQYFRDFANYDLVVDTQPTPLTVNALQAYTQITDQDQALQLSGEVAGEDYPLMILDKQIKTLDLDMKLLKKGIIIPEYYAEKWRVTVGDQVEVNDTTVEISGIFPLSMGLSIFTSFEYANQVFAEVPQVYNTVYVQTNQLDSLEKALAKNEIVYATAEDDRNAFATLLDNLQVLILLLIICGVILGVTVVLCINLMNLTVREFEYMFLNIMGYSKGKIIKAISKETFFQLLIAIPVGFLAGFQLLNVIKGEFSQNTFALYPLIKQESFLMVTLIIVLMSSLRLVMANYYIDHLNIVEGLKVQDE